MDSTPRHVRPLTDAERDALVAALRSSDAFVLRRAQIILASARGERVSSIAPLVGFSGQAVRLVIHAFNGKGLGVLQRRSTRNHTTSYSFNDRAAQALRELLHQSPRLFGQEGERLDLWIEAVQEQGAAELRRFALGLHDDYEAVRAGLTLVHSNGQTEGFVNKLKFTKRAMYGRGKFDLLRQRVLRVAWSRMHACLQRSIRRSKGLLDQRPGKSLLEVADARLADPVLLIGVRISFAQDARCIAIH